MKDVKTILKEGVTLHEIKTDKFKTNLCAVFLSTPLTRENITKGALVPMVLRRGSSKIKTQEEISKVLEEMYGAGFDCGIEKTGNNQVLKFYVFNPLIVNNEFKNEYVNSEKENLKQIIQAKIDNKAKYAYERCIEEMYKNKPYGLYKFGYIEDLENINSANLYDYYKTLINECKIDIFVSGNINEMVKNKLEENLSIKNIQPRKAIYEISEKNEEKEDKQENEIIDKLQVNQGKLVIGLDIKNITEDEKYSVSVYNILLGGSANSKLFQNVREKASLAYTASSSYLRQKNNIIIRAGIEIDNFEKALNLIKEQLDDMKNSKFQGQEVENAKQLIISTVNGIPDSQDAEITYYFGQELAGKSTDIEQYVENIRKVQPKQINEVAKKIDINTIYFLRN